MVQLTTFIPFIFIKRILNFSVLVVFHEVSLCCRRFVNYGKIKCYIPRIINTPSVVNVQFIQNLFIIRLYKCRTQTLQCLWQCLRIFLLTSVKQWRKNAFTSVRSIKLHFSIFSFASEYVRSLSAKNLLVWDKNLRRGSVGTSERREFEWQ